MASDHELLAPGGHGHLLERAPQPVVAPGRESILHPAGSVVDHDVHRAKMLLGGIEQRRRSCRVRQVSLDCKGLASSGLHLASNRFGVLRAMVAVGLRDAGINRVLDAQERA